CVGEHRHYKKSQWHSGQQRQFRRNDRRVKTRDAPRGENRLGRHARSRPSHFDREFQRVWPYLVARFEKAGLLGLRRWTSRHLLRRYRRKYNAPPSFDDRRRERKVDFAR